MCFKSKIPSVCSIEAKFPRQHLFWKQKINRRSFDAVHSIHIYVHSLVAELRRRIHFVFTFCENRCITIFLCTEAPPPSLFHKLRFMKHFCYRDAPTGVDFGLRGNSVARAPRSANNHFLPLCPRKMRRATYSRRARAVCFFKAACAERLNKHGTRERRRRAQFKS